MKAEKILAAIVLLLIFLYLFILQIQAIWSFTIDDMYISLRYAKHLAQGYGLLWNINEYPVEGYSNFSFVMLAAAAIKMGQDPVSVLKLCGFFGLLLTVLALFNLSRLWFNRWIAWFPCIALLLYKGQIIWSISGLETTVYQALVGFSLYYLLRGIGYQPDSAIRCEAGKWQFALSGLLLALASLTRPEAPVLLIVFYGLALWDSPEKLRNYIFQGIVLAVLIFALIYIPYFFWRWHYFGRLLPNPVYCKGFSAVGSFQLDRDYLSLVWPFMLLALPVIFKAKNRLHYFFWLPGLVYLLLLANADPIVAFYNRLFLPAFQLLLPLALAGLCLILEHFFIARDRLFTVSLFVCFLFMITLFIPVMSLEDFHYFTKNPQKGERMRSAVVRWLDNNVTAGSKVVLADSGMIPWLGSFNFIDSYCLNNREMTSQIDEHIYERFCTRVLKEKPAVIILTSLLQDGLMTYTPADACLRGKLKDNKDWQFRKMYQTGDSQSSYRYEIYTKDNRAARVSKRKISAP